MTAPREWTPEQIARHALYIFVARRRYARRMAALAWLRWLR